ncbi:MAG: KTSC domain-containing protein [Synergistaceae bacterium]|nr:KTSC domain-containing protein [Synergistaceae bacterium]MBQ6969825.1 KTSC domain-containing protein [Synergistaceae bacterium]
MKRLPVESDDLKSVGYDEKERKLEIEFRNGWIYEYTRVPPEIYGELVKAESKGTYFAKAIKNSKYYGCTKLYPEYRLLRI